MLMSGRAKVDFDPDELDAQRVAKAVSGLGFGANVLEGHAEGRHTIHFEVFALCPVTVQSFFIINNSLV